MTTRIRFFGAAAFEVGTPTGMRIMIDPFLDEHPVSPIKSSDLDTVDLVRVTHGAYDHLGDAAQIAARDGAPLVCGPEVREALTLGGMPADQVLPVAWGMAVDFRGVRGRPVETRHSSPVEPVARAPGAWWTWE